MTSSKSLVFLDEHNLIWYRTSGPVVFQSLIEDVASVRNSEGFKPHYSSFIELKDTRVKWNPSELENYHEVFRKVSGEHPPRKWAIYTNDPETLKIANMLHLDNKGNILVGIFSLRRRALEWLGVSDVEELAEDPKSVA